MLRWLPEDVSPYGAGIDALFYLIYYITTAANAKFFQPPTPKPQYGGIGPGISGLGGGGPTPGVTPPGGGKE